MNEIEKHLIKHFQVWYNSLYKQVNTTIAYGSLYQKVTIFIIF